MAATRNKPNAADMTPERWQRVKGLLAAALETDCSERPAYLDKVCAGDAWLRAELENLLAAGEEVDAGLLTLRATTGPAPEPGSVAPANVRIGRRLGPYQIVEEIGLGGMGEVYRAFRADDQYKKEVAIKLMRSGQDSKFVVARFRNERQVLASLDHPNIARLLDGGTTDEGMPYFVMELIAGQPITEYCDGQQLSTSERLKLFLQVCSAVQYAHQRLIIHRDLKPSNILVTCDGQPKLLDFGIAKILDPAAMTEGSEPTLTLFRLLTPAYASPEQVRGEAITTVSDVYSLGVLLYELLTGQRPYRVAGRSPHEIEQAVCEWEPPRPSSVLRQRPTPEGAGGRGEITSVVVRVVGEGSAERLSKRLRGDLDNIVLQALRKEPQRRYPSVEQLATDIRRHLENLPVSASKDTLRYRTAKFVRRHKAGVVASCAIALTVLAALAVTLREAHIARVERARAERRFSDVRKLANSLLFEIHDAIRDLPGATRARGLLVQRGLEYLDSLSGESHGDSALQRELAAAYEKVGDVQGQALQANLGDKAGAVSSYEKALSIRKSLADAAPRDLGLRRELTANYGKLSDLFWNLGNSAAAMENSQKALALAQSLYDADPQQVGYRRLLAAALLDYGYKQAMVGGNAVAGLDNTQKATALLEQLVAKDPENKRLRRTLGLSYSRAGEIISLDPEQSAQALGYFRQGLAVHAALSQADPNNAELRRLAAYDQFAVGQALANVGNYSEALQNERAALAVFRDLSGRDAGNAELKEDIGYVQSDLGKTLFLRGDLGAAIGQLHDALSQLGAMAEAQEPRSRVGSAIAADQYWMGKAYVQTALTSSSVRFQRRNCLEAQTWLHKSLRGLSSTGPHAPSPSGSQPTAADIGPAMAACDSVLGAANVPAHH